MANEDTLPKKPSIDDNDYARILTEENVSALAQWAVIKQYLGEGTATPYIDVVNIGDDKGLICTEQWSVKKKEAVFGGDSYPVGTEDTTPDGTPNVGSAWHCEVSNTTNMVITGATDITTTLASDAGSTIGLFGGTTAGRYILVGSEYPFGGAKAKMDTAGVIEPDNVLAEYLQASNTWVNAPFMATNSGYQYEQYANVLSASAGKSEQWFFGFNPLVRPTAWDKVTLTINGVGYTKHWARFRIDTAITTDPVMQQIKLHTDAFEIEADGATSYRGRSRVKRTILEGIHNTVENNSKNPKDQNVEYAVGMVAKYKNNKLENNTEDGFLLPITIPEGLDTSIPLVVRITGYPLDATDSAKAVKFGVQAKYVTEGFEFTDSNPVDYSITAIDNFPAGSAYKRRYADFLVPVSSLLPGDEVVISFFRMGNDPEDTLVGNAIIENVKVDGHFWRA